jgi:enamine deaminase RidA (YjgF/YER057c/UK114 family)
MTAGDFCTKPLQGDNMGEVRKPDIRFKNPPALSPPTGYTHVVEVSRGRTVYIAGQVSRDTAGNLVGAGDFAVQTRQVMENLTIALASVGATFENVVKITTYVTDMSHIRALREIRAEYFGQNPPANTLVQVVQLAQPELMIEIEAIAILAE